MLLLAWAEITGPAPTFLERLFAGKLQGGREAIVGDDLIQLALFGGFPEAISRESERRRQDWARSYLTSVLTRDLRDIAEIEKLTELPKFVRLFAEHSGQLVNYSQFGSGINVSHKKLTVHLLDLDRSSVFADSLLEGAAFGRIGIGVKVRRGTTRAVIGRIPAIFLLVMRKREFRQLGHFPFEKRSVSSV